MEKGCTDVVMESTGRKAQPPIAPIPPINCRRMRQPSFIPPRDIRELRDLTRRRRTLLLNGGEERNRVQKILEDANVKVGNVLSGVFGVSEQAILEALLGNKLHPEEMDELAKYRAHAKMQP